MIKQQRIFRQLKSEKQLGERNTLRSFDSAAGKPIALYTFEQPVHEFPARIEGNQLAFISASFLHQRHFLSIRKSRLYLEGPKVAFMTRNIKETIAYTMPVPMSDEPGPQGPPKPSGTAHMIKLRNKLTVYESLRKNPKIIPKARASSRSPDEYTQNAGFEDVFDAQNENHPASHDG